ncbi:hypothetical protein PCK1_003201, partial [Pneumocystis canis]
MKLINQKYPSLCHSLIKVMRVFKKDSIHMIFPRLKRAAFYSIWANVEQGKEKCYVRHEWIYMFVGPRDPILGINELFNMDSSSLKVNLGVGSYRDDSGKPYVLSSVKEAEKNLLLADLDKEYAPISGDPSFTKHAAKLAYGEDCSALKEGRISVVQSVSGTGALRLGGEFLNRFYSNKRIYLPIPTWGNHASVFRDSGLDIKHYRYYNKNTISFDLKGAIEDLLSAPD